VFLTGRKPDRKYRHRHLAPAEQRPGEVIGITRQPQNYSHGNFLTAEALINLEWGPQKRQMMKSAPESSGLGQSAMEHIDALYGYALALTRDSTEAEDLVQETYLRAAGAPNMPDGEGNLKAWLFVIMRNAWLNQVRHKNSGPLFVDLETGEPPNPEVYENPHVVYLRKLEREQVREAIESLPHAYREIVILRDIEGFTYHEIATVLDCPAGTVMSRLGRARGKLRKRLSAWQSRPHVRAV
jgi:RNA polymerase sigma-70 factor (ECF subfamily)